MLSNVQIVARKIRATRPDISLPNALAIARLPIERVNHLRRHRLLERQNVISTLKTLRFLGEIA